MSSRIRPFDHLLGPDVAGAAPPPKRVAQALAIPPMPPRRERPLTPPPPDVSLATVLTLSPTGLAAITKEQLVELILIAREALQPAAVSARELAKRVDDQRRLMRNGISSSMGWKPTCHEGRAAFKYELVGVDAATFASVFSLALPLEKKMFKLTLEEFEQVFGSYGLPENPVRYEKLVITGGAIVRWQAEDGTATVSGTYGKKQWRPLTY